MKAERYFDLMKNNLRDYNPIYTPWINEIIKLAKEEPKECPKCGIKLSCPWCEPINDPITEPIKL
jgi:hypothetical protein